jgi:hypothetical protein
MNEILNEEEYDKIFLNMYLKTIIKENHGGTVMNVKLKLINQIGKGISTYDNILATFGNDTVINFIK